MFCIVVTIDGQQRQAKSSLATCFRHSVCDYVLIIANKAELSSLTLFQYNAIKQKSLMQNDVRYYNSFSNKYRL